MDGTIVDSNEYIAQRLDDQIRWYDLKSVSNQRWYKGLRMIQFTAAALIPFLTGFTEPAKPVWNLTVGLLGVLIAIITAMLDLYRFQEHWIEYRTTSESLKKEKLLFLTESEPYRNESPTKFQLFVQRVEALISKENSNWSQYISQSDSGGESGKA